MKKQVTIREIAAEAGVSTGTVHRAIRGKKGVSDNVRSRILDICAKRGYNANTRKRRAVQIAAAFPGIDDKNSLFYGDVWRGFRRCIAELHEYNLNVVELPYYSDPERSQSEILFSCFKKYGEELDAIITVGHFDTLCGRVLRICSEHGIPIFLVCDDQADCGRLACVQANHYMSGSIAAELLASQLPSNSVILLCAGNPNIPSHSLTVTGFEDYLVGNNIPLRLMKLYGYENESELRIQIFEALDKNPEITGAFSVSARLSILLAKEVNDLHRERHIRVIASDLCQETIEYMERDIVKNTIYKNPELQAYRATRLMCGYLLRGEQPRQPVEYVDSTVVFRSSLEHYRTGGYDSWDCD